MKVDVLDRGHLEQCVDIDQHTAHPWGRSHWARSLRDDYCLGLWHDGTLMAVCAFSLVFDELSLLNIVVDQSQTGRGHGRLLLEQGLEWMQQFGAGRCMLEVRISNGPARALYQKLGFTEDGVRRNYYPLAEGREDAVLMSRCLPLD